MKYVTGKYVPVSNQLRNQTFSDDSYPPIAI